MRDVYGNEVELVTIDLAGFPEGAKRYRAGDKFTVSAGAPGIGETEYFIHNVNGTKLLCSEIFNNSSIRILEP